jgi:hypothetical protein
MGQNDRRIHVAHDRRDPGERRTVVEDGQVIEQGAMIHRAGKIRGAARLLAADADDLLAGVSYGAQASVGQVPHVKRRSGLLEPKQGPGHHEFNVIRMRADGQNHGLVHECSPTGLPGRAGVANRRPTLPSLREGRRATAGNGYQIEAKTASRTRAESECLRNATGSWPVDPAGA